MKLKLILLERLHILLSAWDYFKSIIYSICFKSIGLKYISASNILPVHLSGKMSVSKSDSIKKSKMLNEIFSQNLHWHLLQENILHFKNEIQNTRRLDIFFSIFRRLTFSMSNISNFSCSLKSIRMLSLGSIFIKCKLLQRKRKTIGFLSTELCWCAHKAIDYIGRDLLTGNDQIIDPLTSPNWKGPSGTVKEAIQLLVRHRTAPRIILVTCLVTLSQDAL